MQVRAGANQDFTSGAREAKATTDTITPKEDNSQALATLEDQNIRELQNIVGFQKNNFSVIDNPSPPAYKHTQASANSAMHLPPYLKNMPATSRTDRDMFLR